MITWVAKYRDGQFVTQHKGNGEMMSADNVDRKLVESFSLLNGEKIIFTLHLDPGQRLIYRRRVEQNVGGEQKVCHLVGWRGDIAQSICYVFEDGQVEMAGAFREDHPWFYSPNLREFEQ